MPTVSVIVTAHNYGRYLRQAVDSVLGQAFEDFELVVVNDGSTDDTAGILEGYEDPRLRVITLDGVGLASAANRGIRETEGEYVIRLDADDYFDENILLILSNFLDRHADFGMVFPDYYRVNKYGEILDQVRQLRVNDEVKLLDRSALAAGALYRRSCYEEIGGYNENLRFQEDYDFWIRFIDRFHVHNVQLPLMYYRQHSRSMSTNTRPRMEARRKVKHDFVNTHRNMHRNVLGVLPITMENRYRYGLPLSNVGGRPLCTYLFEEVHATTSVDRWIVDTDNEEVAVLAEKHGLEVPFLRPRELSSLDVRAEDHYRWLVGNLVSHGFANPDVLAIAAYNHPFIRAAHVDEAIDTLLIHKCSSVISVSLNIKFHWRRGENGLESVTYPRGMVADEKWSVFEESGAVVAVNSDNLLTDQFLGNRVSFIELDELESLRVDSPFREWVAEQVKNMGPDSVDRISESVG